MCNRVNRTYVFAFILSIVSTLSVTSATQAAEFSADYRLSTGTGKPHIGKTYVKGKMRRDDPQNPNGLTVIIRLDIGKTWFLRPVEKAYVEFPTNYRSTLDKLKDKGNVKKEGTSRVTTYLCDKYTYKNTQFRMYGTIYFSPELQTVLKSETKLDFPVRSPKDKIGGISELSKIKPGKQSDALFNIPKGYKKVKMSLPDLMQLPNYKAQKKAPMVNLHNGT